MVALVLGSCCRAVSLPEHPLSSPYPFPSILPRRSIPLAGAGKELELELERGDG